jgi:hypothetical protein
MTIAAGVGRWLLWMIRILREWLGRHRYAAKENRGEQSDRRAEMLHSLRFWAAHASHPHPGLIPENS